jgi:hypothetical protein
LQCASTEHQQCTSDVLDSHAVITRCLAEGVLEASQRASESSVDLGRGQRLARTLNADVKETLVLTVTQCASKAGSRQCNRQQSCRGIHDAAVAWVHANYGLDLQHYLHQDLLKHNINAFSQ